MHVWLGDGAGADVVGSAVGVDAAVVVGVAAGAVTVPEPVVADWASVSFGDADGEPDALSFEEEGDGDAEGSAEAELVAPVAPDVSPRG